MEQLSVSFIRACCIEPIFSELRQIYGISMADLDIPEALFTEEVSLLPVADVNQWLQALEELTGDPVFMLRLGSVMHFDKVGGLGRWFVSTPEMITAIRRINYGINCLQSGVACHVIFSTKLIKWCYSNPFSSDRVAAMDGLRMAMLMINCLRRYFGEIFRPLRVELAGAQLLSSSVQLEQFFGCEVRWGSSDTRLWFKADTITQFYSKPEDNSASVSVQMTDMEEYLMMPQHTDVTKTFYELVNYNRHFGYPTLEFVAARYRLSPQQLQRRLSQYGWNFKWIVSFVLSSEAVRYLKKGLRPEDVAASLGYSNPQSFSKAFKRLRGVTPTQYMARLLQSRDGNIT